MSRRLEREPGSNGRLSEVVQEAIKQYILEHGLRAHDLLPTEGQLAQELCISRGSVREAVKALESLGILGARPGVGLIVRPFSFHPILDNLAYSLLFSRSSIVELLQVREQLEAAFIGQAVAVMTPSQLRVLRSAVDCMGERAARGEDFPEEDRFFHRTLYSGLGNDLLLELLDVFWTVTRRLRAAALIAVEPDPVRAWEDHRRIVEALEHRDPEAARAAVLKHFAGIEEVIQRAHLRAASAAPPAQTS